MSYLKIYLSKGEAKICIDIMDIVDAGSAENLASAVRLANNGAPAGIGVAASAATASADAMASFVAAPTAWAAMK